MERLNVGTSLDMETKREFEETFLGSQAMSYTSSSTGSSFSTSSSIYDSDPFTPSSGRSTPGQHSIDLDSSVNMGLNVDIATPAHAHNYLAAESQKSAMPQMGTGYDDAMLAHSFTSAPMRSNGSMAFDYTTMMGMQLQNYNSSSTQLPFDLSALGDHMHSPFVGAGPRNMTVSMSEMCHIQPYQLESPISRRPSPSASDISTSSCDSDNTTPYQFSRGYPPMTHGSRPMLTPAQQKTTALKQMTELDPRRNRKAGYRVRQNQSDDAYLKLENVQTVETAKFHCPRAGCRKVFRRREHLKRHVTSIHSVVEFPCEFCTEKRDKPFNRCDNYKKHVERHATPGATGKVAFVPAAIPRWEQLKAETKSRKTR